MFEPLQNLQTLQIIQGNIINIPPNIFTPLKKLQNLHLGSNKITRLNSNSFGFLPFLNSFLIDSGVWDQGINEIERNVFDHLSNLGRFGGYGNICFRGILNFTLIDFG